MLRRLTKSRLKKISYFGLISRGHIEQYKDKEKEIFKKKIKTEKNIFQTSAHACAHRHVHIGHKNKITLKK